MITISILGKFASISLRQNEGCMLSLRHVVKSSCVKDGTRTFATWYQSASPLLQHAKFLPSDPSRCCFYSSPQRKAFIPPWLWVRLGYAAKGFAVFFGRRTRAWYKQLSARERQRFHRYALGGCVSVTSGLAAVYFMNLEEAPVTRRKRFVLFSDKTVEEIAQLEAQQVQEKLRGSIVPAGHPLYARVRDVVVRLVRANKDVEGLQREWHVTVINDPQVQAFVMPNGWICAFRGLLDVCPNDDRLAVVLAHEMSHALIGHTKELLSQAHLLQIFLLLPVLLLWMLIPADIFAVLSQSLGELALEFFMSLPYSRSLESEADGVGLLLAAKACYDIREASVFWGIMMLQEKEEMTEETKKFFSTHPSHEDRLEKIEELLPRAEELRRLNGCPRLPRRDPRSILPRMKSLVDDAKLRGVDVDVHSLVHLKLD